MADQTTLTFEVRLETRDMYRFSLTTMFRRFRWFMLLMVFVALGLIVSLVSQDWHWEWGWQSIFGPLFVFVFVPYAFFVAPYFSSRKYLRKNPSLAGPVMYTILEKGIDVSGPHSQAHLSWDAITEALETSQQFLLYPQTAVAHVIPKHLLAADQQATLRALIRSHVKKTKLRG